MRNTLKLLLERGIRTAAICLLLATAAIARAQVDQIDPTSQIQWNLGVFATLPTCTQNGTYTTFPYGAQWGQHAIVSSTNLEWICTPSGWTSAQGCGANNTIANGCTGASTANGAVNNLLAPEVYLSGSASAGTLAAKLAAAPANTKIVLQSNYSETLTSYATVGAANVTLQCNPGATLNLGANLANGMIVVPAVTADGFTMTGCTLNQGGATGQLLVAGDLTGATTSNNVSLVGNTITCNANPFCVQAFFTNNFVYMSNKVTSQTTPLLLSGEMKAFHLDFNTITVSGNGAQVTGIQYFPGVSGNAPIGGHVGWNTITAGGTYANCITGGGYNVLANGYVWGTGDIIEGNNCTLSGDLTLAYSLVVEQGAIVRNNNVYANGHKATAGFELPFAHSLHVTGNNCYQCQNIQQDMWFDNDANDNDVEDNHFYGFLRYGINFEENALRATAVLATGDRNIVASNLFEFSNDNAFSTGPPAVNYPVAIEFRTDSAYNTSEILSNRVQNNTIYGCPNIDFNAGTTPACTTQVNTRGFEIGPMSATAGNFSLRKNTWQNLAYAYGTCRSFSGSGSCTQSTAGDETFVSVTNTLYPGSVFLTTGLQLVPPSFIVGPETVAGPAVAPNGSFAVGAGGLATDWFQGCDSGSSCSSSWTAGYQTISVTAADGSVAELDSNYTPATGFSVATGQPYLISFYAANDGTSGMQVQPDIISITGSTDYCTALLPQTILTGTRSLYSTTCTINSAGGGNLARLRLYTYTPGGPAIGHVTFDSVYVGLAETPPYKPFWSVIVGYDPSGTAPEVCTTAGGVNGDVVTFDANKNCADSGTLLSSLIPASPYHAPLATLYGTTDTVTCPSATSTAFATTYTIPANTITSTTLLKVTVAGTLQTSSSPPGMGIILNLGSTMIWSPYTSAVPGGGYTAVPSGAQFFLRGTATPSASSAVLTNPLFIAQGNASAPWDSNVNNTISRNFATNGTLTLSASLFCTANTAGNSFTLNQMVVEVVSP